MTPAMTSDSLGTGGANSVPEKKPRAGVKISVSIVEDDAPVRESLARLIDGSPGCRCVSRHGSAENALAEIPAIKPDVVLMDINLPGANGVECVRRLKPQLPATQIIMLTVYQNTENIFDALAAGATGYLLKQTPPEELLSAIREVHAGGSPMSSHIARRIVQSFQPAVTPSPEAQSLSPREVQVLDLLAKGFRYKEIAEMTKTTYATVHTHIRHIYEKLHVRSRTEAVAKHLGQTPPRRETTDVK
jgi:DNA-binding NarL/FixJ family response regulator